VEWFRLLDTRQKTILLVLAALILGTLPCYAIGVLALYVAPPAFTPTPTVTLRPTATPTGTATGFRDGCEEVVLESCRGSVTWDGCRGCAPRDGCVLTKTSPFGATTICRAPFAPSAKTVAQKPSGS